MPNLIQSFRQPNPLAETLRSLGNSFFGDQLSPALKRAQYDKLALENRGAQDFADFLTTGGSPEQLAASGALAGRQGQDISVFNRFLTGMNNDPRSDAVTRAYTAAGEYKNSADAFDRGDATDRYGIDTQAATSRANNADTLANDYRQFQEKPEPVMNADGTTGYAQQGSLAQPGGAYKPIPTDATRGIVDEFKDIMTVLESGGIPADQRPARALEEVFKKGGGVTVNNAGENAYDKENAKSLVDRKTQILDAGNNARAALAGLSQLENQMADPNFYSGFGGETFVPKMKQFLVSMGADPNLASSTEAFGAVSSQVVMDKIGSLGTGFSNADRSFVIGQFPGLGNTPEGNKKIIQYTRMLFERQIEMERRLHEYAQTHGGRVDDAFFSELAAWNNANPVIPEAQGGRPGAAQAGGNRTSNGTPWRIVQ